MRNRAGRASLQRRFSSQSPQVRCAPRTPRKSQQHHVSTISELATRSRSRRTANAKTHNPTELKQSREHTDRGREPCGDAPGVSSGERSMNDRAALDWINFLLANVKDGLGPFLAVYLLASQHWDAGKIGIVMMIAGIATVVARARLGALVDWTHWKRGLIVVALATVAAGALGMSLFPTLMPVAVAQTAVGVADAVFPPAIAAISLGIVGPKAFTGGLVGTKRSPTRAPPRLRSQRTWQAGSSRRARCCGWSPHWPSQASGRRCRLTRGRSTTLWRAAPTVNTKHNRPAGAASWNAGRSSCSRWRSHCSILLTPPCCRCLARSWRSATRGPKSSCGDRILPPEFWVRLNRNGSGNCSQRWQFWDEWACVDRDRRCCSQQ
jgi:hypothetical protein